MSNEEIIRGLRSCATGWLAHCAKKLHQNLMCCALQRTEVQLVSTLRRKIRPDNPKDLVQADTTLLNNLVKCPEATREALRCEFGGGFQLALANEGQSKYWVLRWDPTESSSDEGTTLVDFTDPASRDSNQNRETIGKLQQGPRIKLPSCVSSLHMKLTGNAQQAAKSRAADGATGYVEDISCMDRTSSDIIALLHQFPVETREELQRVFRGFQLLYDHRHTWILRWDPNPNVPIDPNTTTVLVDFVEPSSIPA